MELSENVTNGAIRWSMKSFWSKLKYIDISKTENIKLIQNVKIYYYTKEEGS